MNKTVREHLSTLTAGEKCLLFISCVSEAMVSQLEGDIPGFIAANERMRELKILFAYSSAEVLLVEQKIQAHVLEERAKSECERRWR